jgi:hypothetical protein
MNPDKTKKKLRLQSKERKKLLKERAGKQKSAEKMSNLGRKAKTGEPGVGQYKHYKGLKVKEEKKKKPSGDDSSMKSTVIRPKDAGATGTDIYMDKKKSKRRKISKYGK